MAIAIRRPEHVKDGQEEPGGHRDALLIAIYVDGDDLRDERGGLYEPDAVHEVVEC